MSEIDDGGPAFAIPPTTYKTWEGGDEYEHTQDGQGGMSLRQYYAGQAIMGKAEVEMTQNDILMMAKNARRFADALIAELKKK